MREITIPHQVSPDTFQLGNITVNPAGRFIVVDGKKTALQPKVMHLLVTLAKEYPAFVTRDTLINEVWGISNLAPNALSNAISKLRQLLGDDAANPFLIQTERMLGYRLMVKPITIESEADTPASPTAERHRTFTLAKLIAATVIATILGLILWERNSKDTLTEFLMKNPGNWVIEVKKPSNEQENSSA